MCIVRAVVFVFLLVDTAVATEIEAENVSKSPAALAEQFRHSLRSVLSRVSTIRFEIEEFQRKSNWTASLVRQFASVDAISAGSSFHHEVESPEQIRPVQSSGPPLFMVAGRAGESCHQVCHSIGRTCRRHFMPVANTCEAMRGGFGCKGPCLFGYGEGHPAAIFRRKAPSREARPPPSSRPLLGSLGHESRDRKAVGDSAARALSGDVEPELGAAQVAEQRSKDEEAGHSPPARDAPGYDDDVLADDGNAIEGEGSSKSSTPLGETERESIAQSTTEAEFSQDIKAKAVKSTPAPATHAIGSTSENTATTRPQDERSTIHSKSIEGSTEPIDRGTDSRMSHNATSRAGGHAPHDTQEETGLSTGQGAAPVGMQDRDAQARRAEATCFVHADLPAVPHGLYLDLLRAYGVSMAWRGDGALEARGISRGYRRRLFSEHRESAAAAALNDTSKSLQWNGRQGEVPPVQPQGPSTRGVSPPSSSGIHPVEAKGLVLPSPPTAVQSTQDSTTSIKATSTGSTSGSSINKKSEAGVPDSPQDSQPALGPREAAWEALQAAVPVGPAGEAQAVVWCDGSHPSEARLCPCGEHSLLVEAADALRRILREDESERGLELEGVGELEDAMGRLSTDCKAGFVELEQSQQQLTELRARQMDADMTDALLQSLNKVDYESGTVQLPDGTRLPFQAAMDQLASLLAKRGKNAAAPPRASTSPGQAAGDASAPRAGPAEDSKRRSHTHGPLPHTTLAKDLESEVDVGSGEDSQESVLDTLLGLMTGSTRRRHAVEDAKEQVTGHGPGNQPSLSAWEQAALRTGNAETRADREADDDFEAAGAGHGTQQGQRSSADPHDPAVTGGGTRQGSGSSAAVGLGNLLDLPVQDPAMLSYNEHLLQDIACLLAAAAVGGVLASFIGAPPSFGYLIGGAAIGPSGLGIVTQLAHVGTVAQFGVVFPLFANGLHFSTFQSGSQQAPRQPAAGSAGSQSRELLPTDSSTLGWAPSLTQGIDEAGSIPGSSSSSSSSSNTRDSTRSPSRGSAGAAGAPRVVPTASSPRAGHDDAAANRAVAALVAPASHLRQAAATAVILAVAFSASAALAAPALGLAPDPLQGALIGLAASLSSPGVTIANLLQERCAHAPAGRLSAGTLAVQDLLMGLLLSVPHVAASRKQEVPGASTLSFAANALIRSMFAFVLVVMVTVVVGRTVVPAAVGVLAKRQGRAPQEVLFLALVALCMLLAVATDAFGLSLEMGAFFAGLMVAASPVAESVGRRLQPLVQVFGGMFFASIGLIISPGFVWSHGQLILGGLVAVMAAKAATVALAGRGAGLPWGEASLAGLALAQVSEYSLIFTGKAHAMGLLSRRTYLVGLTVTVASLVTSPLAVALHAVMRGVRVRAGSTVLLGAHEGELDRAGAVGVAEEDEESAAAGAAGGVRSLAGPRAQGPIKDRQDGIATTAGLPDRVDKQEEQQPLVESKGVGEHEASAHKRRIMAAGEQDW